MISKYFGNPNFNFMPDGKILRAWLTTSKTSMVSYGVQRPGCYNEPSVNATLGVIILLALEFTATYLAKDSGTSINIIIALVVIDVFFAFMAHYWSGDVALLRNQLVFADEMESDNIQTQITRLTHIKYLFNGLIVVSALFKWLLFYLVYEIIDGTTYTVFAFYCTGALLHITCTGYAISYWRLKWMLDKQFSVFKKSTGKTHSFDRKNPVLTKINGPACINEVTTYKHDIVKRNNDFYFATTGILLDTELAELIARQNNAEAQRVLSIEGVKLQLNMLSW